LSGATTRASLVATSRRGGSERSWFCFIRAKASRAGKVFERIFLNRLEAHVARVEAIIECQYGFRRIKSTTDTIEDVLSVAHGAARSPVPGRHLCEVISLDVKNAFNSAHWSLIDEVLRRYVVPEHLVQILRSYMHTRRLIVNEDLCLPVTCGVPQGSVLGPALLNMLTCSMTVFYGFRYVKASSS